MLEIKGIDLSTWQKEVDWQEVKSDGVHFAILRAGFGNGSRDEMFESHITGALGAGLGVGVYWFLYPASVEDARREARECLKIIEPYKGKINYPVYADYEYDSDRYAQEQGVAVNKAFRTSCITAFCEEIEKSGWYAGYYSNLDYLRNKLDTDRLKRYDLWLADYSGGPEYPCGMQQFTNTGRVRGIDGDVDLNTAYYDYPSRLAEKGCNGLKPSSPVQGEILAEYRVRGKKGGWYPPVRNLSDYAGAVGDAITDIAVKVSRGSVRYRVHIQGGGWLPYVTGYDIVNTANGYAGNGQAIDAVEIYYETPDDIRPYRKAKYRVSPLGGGYWPWQYDRETNGSQDGYAGVFGQQIDRFQLTIT